MFLTGDVSTARQGTAASKPLAGRVAAVVIGRNEGARLSECLAQATAQFARVIYIDSGSTDGSVELAIESGARVIELDPSHPFTAARARNAGLDALAGHPPEYVQFIDGDCVLQAGWACTAMRFLDRNPGVAVVCGRRRERRPDASVFNKFCDLEWDTPVGKARACGGDAMMRYAALAETGRFRTDLIAGEEPELCLRLRAAGWTVWRLDADMTLHDAALRGPGAWLSRARRTGHAFAEGASLHGRGRERHWVGETRRALFWGLLLPLAALGGALLHPAAALLLLAYPLQVARIAMRHGITRRFAWQYGFYLTLSKFYEAAGAVQFWWNRWRGRQLALVEYK